MLNEVLNNRYVKGIALLVTLMSAGCENKVQKGEYFRPVESPGFNNPVMVKDHVTGKMFFYWDMSDVAYEQDKFDVDIVTEPKNDTDSHTGTQHVLAYDSSSIGTNPKMWKSSGTHFKVDRYSHILDEKSLGYAGRAAFGAQCAANNQNSLLDYLKKKK